MPTNANTFNSRVTSEALEAKFRQVFPAQGGAELVQDLFASGVIQPVVDFSTVAEGSVLPVNLQTAWDFATGYAEAQNTSPTLITNPGFWKVDLTATALQRASKTTGAIELTDGISTKIVWSFAVQGGSGTNDIGAVDTDSFVVFLRSGDSLVATSNNADMIVRTWFRQIADVNGTLVNPLGFTFT